MCGIAGYIGGAPPAPVHVEHALKLLANRGPDAHGVHHGRLRGAAVTLLHTRLAIIDLDPRANQPFAADGCVLAFNGELYNYRELRAALETAGHVFRTSSDTEVVLQAYRAYGPACVDRFEGMWAFALLDERAQELFLSRDPFGEKPLFYMRDGDGLCFASEPKALAALTGRTPTVDVDQVRRFLALGYRALYARPRTFFTDVHEFPAACSARVTGATMPEPARYWRLEFAPQPMTMDEAVEGAREQFFRAVEWRLRADVPVACCLSGGIDSTALAATAMKRCHTPVTTFSIVDSDPRYDESDNIGPVLEDLGCEHYIIPTTTEGFLDRLTDLIAYHDAPIATISYYVHAALSREIHARGFKVALSGTGADELYTGYYDHYAWWLAEMHGRPDFPQLLEDWRQSYGAVVRNPVLQDPLAFVRDPARRDHLTLDADLFASFLTEPFDETLGERTYTDNPLRNRMLNELHHEVIPVILREDDLNSMRYSVENRSPYLDRGLAAFLSTVPNEHLIHDGRPKWLLRAAVDGLVPDAVRLDKRKRGFNASILSLLDRHDPDTRERLLAPSPVFDYVRRDAIEAFLRRDLTPNSFSKFLFSFVSVKLFLESSLVTGGTGAECAA